MSKDGVNPRGTGARKPDERSGSRILIVEDEAHLAQGLLFNLQAEGHDAVVAADGEAAVDLLLKQSEPFDAIVLDVMLPGMDGFAVARAIRTAQNYTPVLMLTARGRPEDVLEGFAAGADDYLPKPFELSILLARLNGLLRRSRWLRPRETEQELPTTDEYTFAGKTIDFGLLEVRAADKQVRLTMMEVELLRYLVHNPGRAISRTEILDKVWHLHQDTDTRAIDNFIVRLRRYLEDDSVHPVHLQTVRGIGYRFVPHPKEDTE